MRKAYEKGAERGEPVHHRGDPLIPLSRGALTLAAMTQMTPPGWYPDPGQTAGGPPTERWWDGTVMDGPGARRREHRGTPDAAGVPGLPGAAARPRP